MNAHPTNPLDIRIPYLILSRREIPLLPLQEEAPTARLRQIFIYLFFHLHIPLCGLLPKEGRLCGLNEFTIFTKLIPGVRFDSVFTDFTGANMN
jgi:hypothetical protein